MTGSTSEGALPSRELSRGSPEPPKKYFRTTSRSRDPSTIRWLSVTIAIHFVISMIIVTRTITGRQALVGFPCY
jgi:hypothetical protein